MELEVTLEGVKPIILHNGRLSNPLDPYVRELKTLTSKRKKTDEDLHKIMQIEARAGCYDTPEGNMGLQTAAVFRSIVDSARLDKLGKLVTQAITFADVVEDLLIDGRVVPCEDFLDSPHAIDYRSVKVGMSRTMRARPIVHPDWSSTHKFSLDANILDIDMLTPVISRAGERFGIGDWRPVYGIYAAHVEVV